MLSLSSRLRAPGPSPDGDRFAASCRLPKREWKNWRHVERQLIAFRMAPCDVSNGPLRVSNSAIRNAHIPGDDEATDAPYRASRQSAWVKSRTAITRPARPWSGREGDDQSIGATVGTDSGDGRRRGILTVCSPTIRTKGKTKERAHLESPKRSMYAAFPDHVAIGLNRLTTEARSRLDKVRTEGTAARRRANEIQRQLSAPAALDEGKASCGDSLMSNM